MTKIPLKRSLKAIEVKSCRLHKKTKMCGGYSKLSFFKYEDQFGHVRKVSSDFVRYFQFPKFSTQKKVCEGCVKRCVKGESLKHVFSASSLTQT